MAKCKITALQKLYFPELEAKYSTSAGYGNCQALEEGQVFYTTGPFGIDPPEEFCPLAWQSMSLQCALMATSGEVFGDKGTHIVTCNDGVRPVIFLLEQVD